MAVAFCWNKIQESQEPWLTTNLECKLSIWRINPRHIHGILGPRLWGAFQVCELRYFYIIYKIYKSVTRKMWPPFSMLISVWSPVVHTEPPYFAKRLQPSSLSVLLTSYPWWGQIQLYIRIYIYINIYIYIIHIYIYIHIIHIYII